MSATLGFSRAAAVPRPRFARAAIALALLGGAAAGVAVGMQAAPATDLELMHLLRAMAVLKLAFVAGATGAILWRLQATVPTLWLAGYAATVAAMASGPALIWFASHIIAASILLHAGLAAALILLWRDATTADLLRNAVLRRRAARSPV